MKKTLIVLSLLVNTLINANISQPTLPLRTESDHFKLYCDNQDQDATRVLTVAEKNFTKLSTDFKHTYSTKINIYVFPNIQDFHKAIGAPNAKDWLVNQSSDKTHSIFTVSPQNPGTFHSAESILSLNIVSMTNLFIKDAYTNQIPNYLCLGMGLWMAFNSHAHTRQDFPSDLSKLPTLQQLEDFIFDRDDTEIETLLEHCSRSIIEFINKQWGREKLLALLENYALFEQTLGVTKEAFRSQWISYLQSTYSNNNTATK